MEMVCPLTQPASGAAKNSTPRAMSERLAGRAGRDVLQQRPLAVGAVAVPLGLGGRVGEHEPRRDAVDGDAERAQLVGHLPGEADLAGLRRGVGLDAGEADAAPGARGDVDDPAVAGGLHDARGGPGAVERRAQVGVQDGVPGGVGQLVDRRVRLALHSPGVVDENVQLAEAGEERVHGVASPAGRRCPCRPGARSRPPPGAGPRWPRPMPCAVPVTTAACPSSCPMRQSSSCCPDTALAAALPAR